VRQADSVTLRATSTSCGGLLAVCGRIMLPVYRLATLLCMYKWYFYTTVCTVQFFKKQFPTGCYNVRRVFWCVFRRGGSRLELVVLSTPKFRLSAPSLPRATIKIPSVDCTTLVVAVKSENLACACTAVTVLGSTSTPSVRVICKWYRCLRSRHGTEQLGVWKA